MNDIFYPIKSLNQVETNLLGGFSQLKAKLSQFYWLFIELVDI